jgi:hypothetical protein
MLPDQRSMPSLDAFDLEFAQARDGRERPGRAKIYWIASIALALGLGAAGVFVWAGTGRPLPPSNSAQTAKIDLPALADDAFKKSILAAAPAQPVPDAALPPVATEQAPPPANQYWYSDLDALTFRPPNAQEASPPSIVQILAKGSSELPQKKQVRRASRPAVKHTNSVTARSSGPAAEIRAQHRRKKSGRPAGPGAPLNLLPQL